MKGKKLGKSELLALGVGQVIGAGIITSLGFAIGYTGKSAWLAYFAAVVYGFIVVIPYLFLGATLKVSGGQYSIVLRLLGKRASGIYVTAYILQVINMSIFGLSFGMYLNSVIPSVDQKVAGLVSITVFYVLNLFGVNIMAKVQKYMSAVLILAFLIFIVFGLPHVNPDVFQITSADFMTDGFTGFFKAAMLLVGSCTAHSLVLNYSVDAENPKRDIPFAIIGTSVVLLIIYTLTGVVASGVLPVEQVANQPLTLVADIVLPKPLFYAFIIGGPLMALTTTMNSCYGAHSKPLLKGCEDGWLPKKLAVKNRYNAPYLVMTGIFLMGVIPIIAGLDIDSLMNGFNLIMFALGAAVIVATWNLPRRYPKEWEQSAFHIPTGLFHFLILFSFIAQMIIIIRSAMNLTVTLIAVVIGIAAFCTIYALSRSKNIQNTEIDTEETKRVS